MSHGDLTQLRQRQLSTLSSALGQSCTSINSQQVLIGSSTRPKSLPAAAAVAAAAGVTSRGGPVKQQEVEEQEEEASEDDSEEAVSFDLGGAR